MFAGFIGVVLLCVLSVSADNMHDCYKRRLDQVIVKDNYFQCKNTETTKGGASLCCKEGDQCGEDSICRTRDTSDSHSQWYVGGCSDRTYNDPICRKDCTGFTQTWISWNDTQDVWACCGHYDCYDKTTNHRFNAISLAEWSPIPQNTIIPFDDPDKSGLSTGAIAGIGVGVGVLFIALVVGTATLWMSRRRKAKGKNYNTAVMGQYAKIDPQPRGRQYDAGAGPSTEMQPFVGSSNLHQPPSRGVSPVGSRAGSRAASPAPAYTDRVPMNAATQAASTPDH